MDRNLLMKIIFSFLVFFFLLFVVSDLLGKTDTDVKVKSVFMPHIMIFSLIFFVTMNMKGVSLPPQLLVFIVITLVVIGLALLIWAAATGNLGGVLSSIFTKLFPF